jgi:hypothetical protein
MITPNPEPQEEHSAFMGSLHWTGATTVLPIRTLTVGPGQSQCFAESGEEDDVTGVARCTPVVLFLVIASLAGIVRAQTPPEVMARIIPTPQTIEPVGVTVRGEPLKGFKLFGGKGVWLRG